MRCPFVPFSACTVVLTWTDLHVHLLSIIVYLEFVSESTWIISSFYSSFSYASSPLLSFSYPVDCFVCYLSPS